MLKPLPTVQPIEPSKFFCNAIVEERPQEVMAGVTAVHGAGIWLVDRDMRIRWMNEEMESIYGRFERLGGRHCYEAFRGRESKCSDCLPTKTFETKNIISGYISRVTKDGVQRFYQLVEAPMFDENNEVSRVMEIVLDVTEKARLERTLRASEREYRALFEQAGTAVAVTDRNGVFVKVNRQFEQLSGYAKKELEGKCHHLQFVHPKDRERIRAYTESRTRDTDGAPTVYEFSFVDRWGAERLLNISVSTLVTGDQICSLVDVTDLRKLENEIRSKEQFLSNILRYSVEAILALDPQGHVRSWNHGAEMMFGYASKEIVGRRFSALLAPEVRRSRNLKSVWARFHREGFLRNFAVPTVAKDGRRFLVEITRTAIRDAEGKELGSSAILRDITARRRNEQRMIQQEKMSALGELAASLAHEVKNPLNSMVINMEVMRKHFGGLPDPQKQALTRYLDVLSEEIQRLDNVMRGILDFARPMDARIGKVDIRRIVGRVIALVEARARKGRIRIRSQIEGGLPAVEGSEDHLKQVLLNLLLNAFEAMPKGGSVTLAAGKAEPNMVEVSVTDTGVGIPRKNFNRVFDLYFSTKEKGSGLGLPLAQRLVKAHGGEITFKSRVNHGTTFSIALPSA